MFTDTFFSLRHDAVLPVQTKRLSPCSVWVRSVHLFLQSCVTHELSLSISISQTQCTVYDHTATLLLPIYRLYYMRVWAIRSNFDDEKNQQWNSVQQPLLLSSLPTPCCAQLGVSLWGAMKSEPWLTVYTFYIYVAICSRELADWTGQIIYAANTLIYSVRNSFSLLCVQSSKTFSLLQSCNVIKSLQLLDRWFTKPFIVCWQSNDC